MSGKTEQMCHREPPIVPDTLFAFDGLVIASGTNTWSCLPPFKGQENFKGEIIHSENCKNSTSCPVIQNNFTTLAITELI